jgi:hypothetical protein
VEDDSGHAKSAMGNAGHWTATSTIALRKQHQLL